MSKENQLWEALALKEINWKYPGVSDYIKKEEKVGQGGGKAGGRLGKWKEKEEEANQPQEPSRFRVSFLRRSPQTFVSNTTVNRPSPRIQECD